MSSKELEMKPPVVLGCDEQHTPRSIEIIDHGIPSTHSAHSIALGHLPA